MELKNYPEAIANKQHEILLSDQKLHQLRIVLEQMNLDIEKSIAVCEWENAIQEKIAQAEMRQDPSYQAALFSLQREQYRHGDILPTLMLTHRARASQ
jgi:hypothetical protein